MRYLSVEHLPFAITDVLMLVLILLPPLLLIIYPCKFFNSCLNHCHKRRWHAMHIFVEAFHGCYKNGVTEGIGFRSMSGVYMLFPFVLLVINFSALIPHVQISWLLRALLFLSSSILHNCTALQEKLHERTGCMVCY